METFNEVWDLVCERLRKDMSNIAYESWIKTIEPVSMEGSVVTLRTFNTFHKRSVESFYKDMIASAFAELFGAEPTLNIVVKDAYAPKPVEEEVTAPVSDYEYNFDTFIVGESNNLAHAASIAVATHPSEQFNPFMIYGNSGLGKTHLLYAIRNHVQKNHPEMKVCYIKGDDFTNELINAIASGSTQSFHQKYRQVDMLLVDDIQFIAGKIQTQEEFFHTFNALYQDKKQIVLTSDRPPKEIQTLEDRLRTRFESGLLTDIQPPHMETRMAIVKRKAQLLDIDLNDDICEFIAKRLKNNIRELEGAVKKMRAFCLLDGQRPSLPMAQKAISDILNNDQPAPVTVNKILEEVGRTYGVSADELRSSKRSAAVSKARQIAIYAVREITQMPLAAIGEEFGGRDHSTCVYAIQQIEKLMKRDSKVKATVEDIIKNIRDR